MPHRKSITTILICLGILTFAGCGSDDGPTEPTPQQTNTDLAFKLGDTRYSDWVDSEFLQPQGGGGNYTYSLFGHGNFGDRPVWLDLLFNSNGLLNGIDFNAVPGCDLVSINGIPMGPTLQQVVDGIGEPDSVRYENGVREAFWEDALGAYSAEYMMDEGNQMTRLAFYPQDD